MTVEFWSVRANMTQGWIAVGGRLAVVDDNIAFTPHALDRSIGARPFERPLVDLASIDLAPRTFHPFNGGLRRRLRLRMRDGSAAMFVTNGVVEVGERLARSAKAAGGSPRLEI